MFRRTFLATIALLAIAAAANAGPVSLFIVADPATTAFAGVPAVPGLGTVSNRSGAGTWHLYAVDEASGSFGIAQIKAQLIGVTPIISNRMTQTLYDISPDDTGFKAGLTLLRSGNNVNPITGSAELAGTQPYTQGGLGITAGNYNGIPGDAKTFSGTTNGQWGNYSPTLGALTSGLTLSFNNRSALFVAEGTYTGVAPIVDLANSFVAFYNTGKLTTSSQATAASTNPLINTNPFFFYPEPATMTLVGMAVVGFGGLVGRRRS